MGLVYHLHLQFSQQSTPSQYNSSLFRPFCPRTMLSLFPPRSFWPLLFSLPGILFPGRSSTSGSFSLFRFQLNGPHSEDFTSTCLGSASLLDSITLSGYYPDSNSHYPDHFVRLFTCFLTPTPTMSHMPPEMGLSHSQGL